MKEHHTAYNSFYTDINMLKSVFGGTVRSVHSTASSEWPVFFLSLKKMQQLWSDTTKMKQELLAMLWFFFMYRCNHSAQQKTSTIMNMNTDSTVFFGVEISSHFSFHMLWFVFVPCFGFHLFDSNDSLSLSSYAFTSFGDHTFVFNTEDKCISTKFSYLKKSDIITKS